jgi:hypothetical protein
MLKMNYFSYKSQTCVYTYVLATISDYARAFGTELLRESDSFCVQYRSIHATDVLLNPEWLSAATLFNMNETMEI